MYCYHYLKISTIIGRQTPTMTCDQQTSNQSEVFTNGTILMVMVDSPLPVLGNSVHISLTPSRTMLQCLSKAFTRPSNFLLFLQLMRTWVLFFTLSVSTLKGPVWNSSCSLASLSSGVSSEPLEAIFLFLQEIEMTS